MAEIGFERRAARQRCYFCWSRCSYTFFWVGIILLLYLPCYIPQVLTSDQNIKPSNDSGVCSSVDIRNTLTTFEKLRGCRVVEGFVQILLFDNFNESSFSNITFPELREITDYLLLYRVNGLKTLSHMFPNLTVIRGQSLFFTAYAIVIFEMSSLQDIGLHSLTDITQGNVRIDKNPSLCFVNSIDWDLITHETGINFIKNIRPENECPLCPGDDSNAQKDESSTKEASSCPNSTKILKGDNFDSRRHLCWNRQHCQKVCNASCGKNRSCNEDGECCDEQCLGGCFRNVSECKVCRNFTIISGEKPVCSNKCPTGYYEHLDRRCVTEEECRNISKPVQLTQGNTYPEKPYKIYKNKCTLTCPKGYEDDYKNHICAKCRGKCTKECPGVNVNTLDVAKQLLGCTHITGPLEIQVRGGEKIVKALEESMSSIEVIDGYLKIVRSFPLMSLNFLKSLKNITGKTLESGSYAFVVLDNQNLQDIWDWTNRTLTIGRGSLFFHFNPKLCLYKITELKEKAKLRDFTDLEVAANSNGDKIACNVTQLKVDITAINSKAVILKWEHFEIEDQRKLLGYVIYSIEAPYTNVSLYDGRDACGGDGWSVQDVGVTDDTHPLINLKPYTQYAFYVKTYTTATYRNGGQSEIQYFRTKADEPTEPRSLVVKSNSSDSFVITWQEPQHPNGNVTSYIVTGKKHELADGELIDRNYCDNPITETSTPVIDTKEPKEDNKTCNCNGEDENQQKSPNEEERQSQIQFEDALHNLVYVKRNFIPGRKKRDVANDPFPSTPKGKLNMNLNNITNETEPGTDIWESFSFVVYGKTELHVQNLHHYTVYDINVQACRELEENNDYPNCSRTAVKTERTRRREGADDVQNVQVISSNQSSDDVVITWNEPSDPNGRILTYNIEYRSVTVENTKPYIICITRQDFLNASRTYTIKKKNLTPGNYSLRLAAVSQVGAGRYSREIRFVISESSHGSPILYSILATLFVVAMLILLLYLHKRKASKAGQRLIRDINPAYVSTEYVVDEWEVPRKKIELKRELGQGSFGMVYEGLARDLNGKSQIKCAVKTVNEHATNRERIEFLNEASVMKAFDTAHVVRLLGVVSQGQPTLVIMELMANGDLKSYLRSHRPDAENYDPALTRQPPTLKQILKMALEIADGMAYLAAKKFVHRDLAARNCMVAEEMTVKIGDFGMTRDIYETDYYRKGTKGLLPVRWMAPESLKDGVFTSSSDIWSYGIVLWEMATLASQPYQGLSNEQVLRYVIDGGVMERPENCPDKLYALMSQCWKHKPHLRPTFLGLCSQLVEEASTSFAQISFYHSSMGIEARAARPAPPSPHPDDPTAPLRGNRDPENFPLAATDDDEDDEEDDPQIQVDRGSGGLHIGFSSIPVALKENSTLANGHVSAPHTSDATTSQC